MKTRRITGFIAALALSFAGCALFYKPMENGKTLDQALLEASTEIDGTIAKGWKIAPVNFNSPTDRFSAYVLDELTVNLVRSKNLDVIDRSEIDLRRRELNLQVSGEVDDNSIQGLGRTLGAQVIISGSLMEIGGEYRVVIRVLNVATGKVEVIYRSDIISNNRVRALLVGSGSLPGSGATASSRTENRGQSSASQTLANGTYTLNPRPQGREDGDWKSIYISRVVVDSEYITFYFEDRAEGGSGAAPWSVMGSTYWDRGRATLFNLDDTTKYVTNSASRGNAVGGIVYVVFPRLESRNFKMERGSLIFSEIRLGSPD
jgi:TolB-like protein